MCCLNAASDRVLMLIEFIDIGVGNVILSCCEAVIPEFICLAHVETKTAVISAINETKTTSMSFDV